MMYTDLQFGEEQSMYAIHLVLQESLEGLHQFEQS